MIDTDNSYYLLSNILTENGLVKKIQELKYEKKIIGLCSGSFDLLHPGHITHLTSAKNFCDVLFVAIATDNLSEKIKSRKGRPVFSQEVRAYSVAQLKPVDFVLYNENEYSTIDLIQPDFYIKGKDYLNKTDPVLDKIKEFLEARGGKIVFTVDEKLSTTQLIEYIKHEIN
ncbi:MAG: adenylyltransferase/cytidyltransferase family protein [Candidatus Nanoarchaeia archaeon]|nr:adenylyltransferase/cytidyltransferase family protein [Candidatus Nanoarchaeia archaeon]MDD5358127.1 adenylyltransferase/cytidyltransferase family protein [Candidatus Nanoarchaeia archaeon]MDD5589314.1 adenylyltransferase/cytidyltransferase family protein [Candidatus Nanoarchaeia archaeon]